MKIDFDAQIFVQQIKDNSNGKAPFFESDGWFYEEVLIQVYGTLEEMPYKGRGRKPLPKQVPDPALKYAQVVKECQNGQVVNIKDIVLDNLQKYIIFVKNLIDKWISIKF